jgi:hypothetical protein
VQRICDEHRVLLVYLPPYSTDLNPIEQAFAQLKAWCRRHHLDAAELGFEEFLEVAMNSQGDNAKGHFRKCQVGVPLDQWVEDEDD